MNPLDGAGELQEHDAASRTSVWFPSQAGAGEVGHVAHVYQAGALEKALVGDLVSPTFKRGYWVFRGSSFSLT